MAIDQGTHMTMQSTAAPPPVADRIGRLDWPALAAQLDERGFARTPAIYTAAECRRLAAGFDDERSFRATVDMRRHRFGEGEYRYYGAPLPALVDDARHALYPPLAQPANEWARRLGESERFPAELDAFLERCHRAGQRRPTPLMLRYGAGGHNTLHQDLYGDVAFPLQAVPSSTGRGRTTTAASSCCSSSARGRSHARTWSSSSVARSSSSRRGTGRCAAPAATTAPRCATALPPCTPASGSRLGSSSTTPLDRRRAIPPGVVAASCFG